jgi:hypothetical protein
MVTIFIYGETAGCLEPLMAKYFPQKEIASQIMYMNSLMSMEIGILNWSERC